MGKLGHHKPEKTLYYEKYAGMLSFAADEVFGGFRGAFERYLTYVEYGWQIWKTQNV